VWINQGDIILLSLREFQDGKADVIVKYTADEARNRKSIKHYVLDMAHADLGYIQ
jgi:translation initiation factor 1A